jgi:hypothetical protein
MSIDILAKGKVIYSSVWFCNSLLGAESLLKGEKLLSVLEAYIIAKSFSYICNIFR